MAALDRVDIMTASPFHAATLLATIHPYRDSTSFRHDRPVVSCLSRLRFPWIRPATHPSSVAFESMELRHLLLYHVGLPVVSEPIRQLGCVAGQRHQLGASLV